MVGLGGGGSRKFSCSFIHQKQTLDLIVDNIVGITSIYSQIHSLDSMFSLQLEK